MSDNNHDERHMLTAVRMHPVIVMNLPVVVAPQPMAIPTYPNPPWTVTC